MKYLLVLLGILSIQAVKAQSTYTDTSFIDADDNITETEEDYTQTKYEYHKWESEDGKTLEIEGRQEADNTYSIKGRYSVPLKHTPYPTIEAAY